MSEDYAASRTKPKHSIITSLI